MIIVDEYTSCSMQWRVKRNVARPLICMKWILNKVISFHKNCPFLHFLPGSALFTNDEFVLFQGNWILCIVSSLGMHWPLCRLLLHLKQTKNWVNGRPDKPVLLYCTPSFHIFLFICPSQTTVSIVFCLDQDISKRNLCLKHHFLNLRNR